MRRPNRWQIGDWTFYQIEDHGFTEGKDQPLFAFGDGSEDHRGRPKYGELYNSLEHAMAAAIAEKYTGPRGAGGRGVGTAADWFMRMIGADQVVPVDAAQGEKALAQVIEDTRKYEGAMTQAEAMADALEARGLVLAALNHGK
jgi:hypothetical protein